MLIYNAHTLAGLLPVTFEEGCSVVRECKELEFSEVGHMVLRCSDPLVVEHWITATIV